LYLAEQGALYKQVELSTTKVAKELGLSQQTISRKLIDLEDERLIERASSNKGMKIKLTSKGIDRIKQEYDRYKKIFENKLSNIQASVESGIGEGSYYVSQPKYVAQFIQKLNIDPYSGTLNVKVDYPKFLQFISSLDKIIIDGFKSQNRSFGQIIAYRIKVNGERAAIVIPDRTSHSRDTIEIISRTHFRKRFKLKDNDKVRITN
jgi:riboflavin kinase